MDAVELRTAKSMVDAVRQKTTWLAQSASTDVRMRLQAEILGELAGLDMLLENLGADAKV